MLVLLFVGIFFILWSLLCFYYYRLGDIKPFFMVMSQKTIDKYREDEEFDDNRILVAVQVQGTIFFLIGVTLLFVWLIIKYMF